MKRTVSVNIKGMNFLIEEDAYELLQDYMDRLSHGLRNEKGSKEITEDIELRIAELCSSKLTDKKQVIEIEDIQSILETLGDPSQYIDDESPASEPYSKKEENNSRSKATDKRLFRDVDNATIAGVCAGIANFFHIDVVVVRAIFVVMFFFGGFGFPLYIILWIIVPKANSTIDKLRMHGKAITVESVREEVETAAHRLNNETKTFAQRIRKDDSYSRRFSSIGRLIAILFGTFFIVLGLFFLVTFLIFSVGGLQVIPVQSESGFLSLPELGELVLSDSSDYKWAWIGSFLGGFSVIFFILLLGVKLVFNIRNKWSKMSLGFLFLSGFIGTVICIYIGAKTGSEMTIEGEIEREIGSIYTEQLIINSNTSTVKNTSNFKVKSNGHSGMIGIEENRILKSGIHFEYVLSKDSLFHVHQNFSAHSQTHKMALGKAKNIQHFVKMDSTNLNLNTFYTFPKTDKLRDQKVYMIIEIPKGKSIKFNNQVIRLGSEEGADFDEYYDEDGYLGNDGVYNHWD